jgi:lactate dehydrogenase-like 2-hydroxyacid dehydrogenase
LTQRQRIILTRLLPPRVEERARRDYDAFTNSDDRLISTDELLSLADGAAALLVSASDKLTRDVIGRMPESVKVISTYSTGTDHIDLNAAREKGLRVTNTPHTVTVPTAEIAMLLILAAARRATEGQAMVRSRQWPGYAPTQLLGTGVVGKRLGIFGMGTIGRILAKMARGFDMEVHYHNRSRLPAEQEQGATYHGTLDSLLAVSDFLSLNAPSTAETQAILNADTIAKLPQGAIVVNTARGDLINDEDLIAALKSGRIAAAGLDVYKGEPNMHEGYYGLDNAFLLPHLGSATVEARDDTGYVALDNIDAVLAGREPPFAVV